MSILCKGYALGFFIQPKNPIQTNRVFDGGASSSEASEEPWTQLSFVEDIS
ncbi:hypothetical protein [Winogradskyella forsetii]|uniref:hypothetical protein n=1 Tax=Winogradskyella forsetii TaxID=2686077 RepID=UPI0015C09E0A|nr:hypothetical protein [Winogradskyella forsetii]